MVPSRRLKPKHRRLIMIGLSLATLAVAAFLILRALDENLVFFYSPTMVAEKKPAPEQRFRIGGLVEEGSVQRREGRASFRLTDGAHTIGIVYAGALPDLFREGQGIVANGALDRAGVFVASEVLAKHDENYMPPEIAEALKKSGRWKEGEPAPGTPKK
ncbi:MAG: CcmE/CycJ protein [Alphaproteobacteria bacterium]|jgi:cytochrome c-type biogenesis protein CcmE|nr:CcmE/CycJ protein [Alphaproteobacteria bacterium]